MLRRLFIAAVAAVGAFTITFAFAASLGGLNADSLGADDSVVASCDTDGVSVSYSVAYDATAGTYQVPSVDVSGISDTCDGMTLNVTVASSSGTALASGSTTIPTGASTSTSLTLSSAVAATSLANVHVAIT